MRQDFRGKAIIKQLIDLLPVSPVVIGLSLFLVYGVDGFIGGPLSDAGIDLLDPGLILATVFVSLPFVVREVMPVLVEIGDEEQAATTLGSSPWQTFWRITLPRSAGASPTGSCWRPLLALGEFGAVAVVSGRSPGADRDASHLR